MSKQATTWLMVRHNSIEHPPCSRLTGYYFVLDDNDSLTMGVSPPTFNGKTRWILVNRRITEKNQAFDDRYMYVSFICLFQDLLTIFLLDSIEGKTPRMQRNCLAMVPKRPRLQRHWLAMVPQLTLSTMLKTSRVMTVNGISSTILQSDYLAGLQRGFLLAGL